MLRLSRISLGVRPLKRTLEFMFFKTKDSSKGVIRPGAFFNRNISLCISFTAFSALGFLFLFKRRPTTILTPILLSKESLVNDSRLSAWKAVAPSTRISVPVSGKMSSTRWIMAFFSVSAV